MGKLGTLLRFPADIWLMTITYMPGRIGFRLRYAFWKKRLKYLGKKTRIDTGVYLQNPAYIAIDENCWIDKNVMILAGPDESKRERIFVGSENPKVEPGVVHIGRNVHIAPGCIISGISAGVHISDNCGVSANSKIYAFCHHYRSKKKPGDKKFLFALMVPHDRQCLIEGPVYLGQNAGVALNSVILPGVHIPDNCFVTINSVVKAGKYKANSIISGNPAKRIRDRFESHE